ncbi:ATP-binding/permease fusion ABC transporter [Roseivivax marinus]|uniref:ATP-binding/permease fusion ABC transporter n=1 Tax=Roseivivax marinus TaxID=1379903 RepID=W4HM40_9RHOB|nr:ATP-binding cassette domain-containing protein [Roseivivax marinus]ETW13458.1 ATP-binding/permease fusion ABC transporter [Roseivivax marinus]
MTAPAATAPTLHAIGGAETRAAPVRARHSSRAEARADLLRLFARLRGVEGPGADLLEALTRAAGANDSYDGPVLAAGLSAAGLTAEVRAVQQITEAPVLALMSSGQAVLVLEVDAGAIHIHDAEARGRRTAVPEDEFHAHFAGTIVTAEATLHRLAETHAARAGTRHWFWGEFLRFTRLFGEVALGSMVANLLAVAVALFSLQVYDRVIPHQSEATLWVLAGGAALALVLEGLLKAARAQLLDGAGRQIEVTVQARLMDRLLAMRSEAAARGPARLFSAMRDFGSVREFFTASTVGAVTDLPFLLIFLGLVWSIAGGLVWVLVAGGVLMVLPGLLLQGRMIRLTQDMQGAGVRQSRLLHEAVGELDTIKGARGEARFRRLWEELVAVQAWKSSDQRRLTAALTFWAQGVQQATYVCAVVAGTYLVFAGEFTVGAIIATGILTSRTLAPLTQLAGLLARWGNVRAALGALDEIAHAPQDRADGRSYLRRDRIEGRFDLRGVTYRYDDGPPVLDVQALAIRPGQRVALMGTNGSGKSTLLKLLSGLYAPDAGRLLIDGAEVGQIDPADLRRGIGMLGQEVRLFQGTLRENLNLSLLETDDARLLAALDFAGLGPFVSAHPKGLDLAIGDGGAGLSVGQRQSVGWARLWLQDPDVVLLDEPTAALDQTLEKTLISRLEGWLEGRTAVIATHRVPILSLASRTVILSAGRVAVDGPRDEVLAHLARAGGQG